MSTIHSRAAPAGIAAGVMGVLLAGQAMARANQENSKRASGLGKVSDDDEAEPLEIELGSGFDLTITADTSTSESIDTSTAESGFGIDPSSGDEW